MINTSEMTPAAIRKAGLDILAKELGPNGFVKFMQQFENGSGDYTAERHQWLDGADIDSILDGLRKMREEQTKA